MQETHSLQHNSTLTNTDNRLLAFDYQFFQSNVLNTILGSRNYNKASTMSQAEHPKNQ